MAERRIDNVIVCMKMFRGDAMPAEVAILQSLQHPNIIAVVDAFAEDGHFVLVTEVLNSEMTDLFDFLEKNGPLPEDTVIYILKQVLSALIYMHEQGWAHGDVKDENVVIDPTSLLVKLIDFGAACRITATSLKEMSSPAPPEMYSQGHVDPIKLDAWCCGVLLYTLLYKKTPFTSSYEAQAGLVYIPPDTTSTLCTLTR